MPAISRAALAISLPNIVSSATTPITKKGGLDLGALSWKPNDARIFDQWVKVFDKVDKQKMPPPSRKRPDPAARATFLEALRAELRAANLAKQEAEGRVVLRRLNRVEYENTLHDLLAIDVPLQHYLPEDATTNGFDNVAAGLRLSMLQMEHYLEAADAAISAAMEFRRRPEVIHKRLRYHDEESVRDDVKKKEKKTFRVLAGRGRHLRRQFADGAPPVDRAHPRTIPDPHFGSCVPGSRPAGLAEALRHGLQDPAPAGVLRHAGRQPRHDGDGRRPRARASYSISVRSTPTTTIRAGEAASGESAPRSIPAEGSRSSGSRSKARCSTAGRRPLSAVSSAIFRSNRSNRTAEASPAAGPDLRDRAGDPRVGGGAGAAGIRLSRIPAPGHVGRRRALSSNWRIEGSTTA